MTQTAQGDAMVFAYKVQSALGTPSSGSGATAIDVRPSQGLVPQISQIASRLLNKSKMRLKPRQGPTHFTGAYETELMVGVGEGIIEANLGGTLATPVALTEADLTTCVISGTGTVVTFSGGSVITGGVRAGWMAKFTSMSVAGNNAKWFPILAISTNGRVLTVPSGFLADNASDSAFTLTLAKGVYTASPYTQRNFTFEDHLADVDISRKGTDGKFHGLNFSFAPGDPTMMAWQIMGLAMAGASAGSAPIFTSPTYNAQANPRPLLLLDGGMYVNGTLAANITSGKFGLNAQATATPLSSSRTSPEVVLSDFEFVGEYASCLTDGSALTAALAETQLSMMLIFGEREADPYDFVSVYMGDLAYAGSSVPYADGQIIESLPLVGGRDIRGTGYAESTMVICTSGP